MARDVIGTSRDARNSSSTGGPGRCPVTADVSSVCVYCGSAMGRDPSVHEAARRLGEVLAEAGKTLVYGGASVGLMGVMADAALGRGGRVVGVIPKNLFRREIAHQGLSVLIEVATMHERKQQFFELADAFVALPGGLGTLEELTEAVTWAQLGLHQKPLVVVDHRGYYAPLFQFLEGAVEAGFLKAEFLGLLSWVGGVDEVLSALARDEPLHADKWLELDEV